MDKISRALSDQLQEHRKQDRGTFFSEAEALVRGRNDTTFFAQYWLGMPVNPFQERMFIEIDAAVEGHGFGQLICPTGNQSGKTVAIAILHIKWNFYKRGNIDLDAASFEKTAFQTLNLSPVSRQSKVCMSYVEQILTDSFSWEDPKTGKRCVNKCKFKNFLKSKNENLGRLEFSNNSACYFVATGEDQGANIQGSQFGAITYDECSLSMHLKEELPSKIFSRLAKYGNLLILTSSPKREQRNSSQQYFYHLVQDAKRKRGDFIYVHGILDDNVFIPQRQRETTKERLKNLDYDSYLEVVEGKFVGASGSLLAPEAIQAIWLEDMLGPSEPVDGRRYLIVADWGFSARGDKTVFAIFDYTDFPNEYRICYHYTERGGDPWKLMAHLTYLKMSWNARVLMDTNSLGGTILKKMLAEINPMGFESNGETKMKSLADLVLLLTEPNERGVMKVGKIKSYYIPELEEELAAYHTKDEKLEQDWVMVVAMFAYFIKHRLAQTGGNVKNLSLLSRRNSLRRQPVVGTLGDENE